MENQNFESTYRVTGLRKFTKNSQLIMSLDVDAVYSIVVESSLL